MSRLVKPCCALALLAVLIATPVLIAPPLAQDSFWIDYVWAERFASALKEGVLYPRWLDGSFDGLGAPVFYFYAPLPFYVAGLLGLAGAGTYYGVIGAFVVALFGSGLSMYAWLRGRGAALIGAALYMAMPYHLFDFARRGALGEFFAAAFLPMIAIGIERAAGRRGYATLAIGYAGLILSHVPTALLTSVALIAPYTLYRCRMQVRATLRIASALLLGVGLAAIYLIPAIALQPASNVAALWAANYFKAAYWTILSPATWPNPTMMIIVIGLSVALAVPAIAAMVATRRPDFWALTVIACCALSLGLVPGIWRLPLLDEVQFPWRIFTVAEFAFVTLVASPSQWTTRWRTIGISVPIVLSSIVMLAGFVEGQATIAKAEATRPEVVEYLPAGTRFRSFQEALAFAAHVPERQSSGGVVTVRLFDFPRWIVLCGGQPVPTAQQPGTGLLTYRGPDDCQVAASVLPSERVGLWVSCIALLLLLVLRIRALSNAAQPDISSDRPGFDPVPLDVARGTQAPSALQRD